MLALLRSAKPDAQFAEAALSTVPTVYRSCGHRSGRRGEGRVLIVKPSSLGDVAYAIYRSGCLTRLAQLAYRLRWNARLPPCRCEAWSVSSPSTCAAGARLHLPTPRVGLGVP